MGGGCVQSEGDTSSFLRERDGTCARMYQHDVLQGVIKPLNMTLFSGQEWVIQQDSTAAHRAKTYQEWLRRNFLAFISSENWHSESPDLNPLNCKLWAVLKHIACRKRHSNLESLKRSLLKAAAEIPLETARAVTADWPERLKACVDAEDGHFE